ncbi:MAG: AMP-dependent synthetase [Rheinheimera sp.]|nr:MAG: AMP-dependent synthetase [Rheinheimera sp.]
MSFFWDLARAEPTAIAFIGQQDGAVSYAELALRVEACAKRLPANRSLLALCMETDLQTVCWYLAALQTGHPLILLDAALDADLLQALFACYRPNVILRGEVVTLQHEDQLTLHADLALMLSTSGTTGSPKLVRLSRKNLQSNAEAIASYLQLDAAQTAITTMPLHYSYGLSILNSHLQAGARLVLTQHGLLSREFWQLVQQHQVTSLSGVPYIWQMLRKMRYERFNTDSVRYLTQAGGRLDNDSLQYFQQQTQAKQQQFIVMYGQTEATARIAYLPAELLAEKTGSIGRAIPGGKLWVRQADGQLTDQPDIEGELIYQGPNVMLGYAESLDELGFGDQCQGQLATGDIGYCDPDGCFYITGRAKRFIKMFGLRISLDMVDEVLARRGLDATSTGRDDKLTIFISAGAAVEPAALTTELSALFKINANAIAVHQVAAIPRSTNGKVDGQAIKALMAQYE